MAGREHDLPALRVHVARPEVADGADRTDGADQRSDLQAVFEVVSGDGRATVVAQVPTRSLGLPTRIRSGRDVSEAQFRLDPALAARIGRSLREAAGDDVPAFWLDLPAPRGYLQLVPWEKLLAPELNRPLLRVPGFGLRPTAPGSTLRVVIIAGKPSGAPDLDVAQLVSTVAASWIRSVGHDVLIDVFVDAPSFAGVRDALADESGATVHDPAAAVVPDPSVPSRSAEDDRVRLNPWLEWVTGQLAGMATDVVHLLCHGHLAGDRGTLRLPASPAPSGGRRSARVIDAVALSDSLSLLGAWSLLLGGVPGDASRPGLRALADDVSQNRSGVVLLHDLGSDDEAGDLDAALDMVFGGERCDRPLPGITCWSHPAFASFAEETSPLCADDGTSTLIAGATEMVLAQADTPAWVAAGARVLESLQSEWTPNDGTPPDPESVAALERLSGLFERHVETYALPTDPAEPTEPTEPTDPTDPADPGRPPEGGVRS